VAATEAGAGRHPGSENPVSASTPRTLTASSAAAAQAARARRPAALTSRLLGSAAERASFARMFELHGGSAVSLDYLERAQVRGFFRGAELLAGYVLNARAPFRYCAWLPPQARAELERRGCLVEPGCAEITCMWMSRTLRQLERNRIYVYSVVDAFASGKRLIFAGSTIDKVARKQKSSLPHTVYHGAASFAGTCEIYCADRYGMVAHFAAAAIAKYVRDLARQMCGAPLVRARAWLRLRSASGTELKRI